MDGVPVSSVKDKFISVIFANWHNSAGMGPGVYKTQSKHTKKQVILSNWYDFTEERKPMT